jgi:hypothetical protein
MKQRVGEVPKRSPWPHVRGQVALRFGILEIKLDPFSETLCATAVYVRCMLIFSESAASTASKRLHLPCNELAEWLT